jgi:hypothetical protein
MFSLISGPELNLIPGAGITFFYSFPECSGPILIVYEKLPREENLTPAQKPTNVSAPPCSSKKGTSAAAQERQVITTTKTVLSRILLTY